MQTLRCAACGLLFFLLRLIILATSPHTSRVAHQSKHHWWWKRWRILYRVSPSYSLVVQIFQMTSSAWDVGKMRKDFLSAKWPWNARLKVHFRKHRIFVLAMKRKFKAGLSVSTCSNLKTNSLCHKISIKVKPTAVLVFKALIGLGINKKNHKIMPFLVFHWEPYLI